MKTNQHSRIRNICAWPGPMEGVMRPPVVAVCNQLALAPGWVTPFFRVSQSVPAERELANFLAPFGPSERPVILQLMGRDAVLLAETALRGMAAGAAGIDLNCGCPSHTVTAHGAGGGLLRDAERLCEIVQSIRAAIPGSWFSIKLRLGFDCPLEAGRLLHRLERAGAPDGITLHYRTVAEGYRTVPGREARLLAARKEIRHACVLGNGDVQSVDEAAELMNVIPLDGVMIGRGFWRDPWILRRFQNEEKEKQVSPEAARSMLWNALCRLPYAGDWSLGNAIELASLIYGGDSEIARRLKREFQLRHRNF